MNNVTSSSPSRRKAWLGAIRLRTLPLTLSSIGLGSLLAAAAGRFHGLTFGLGVLTTVLLQILSNLANDYGDSVHGADHADRQGPQRAVQSGIISAAAMRRALVLVSVLALFSGLALLYVALAGASWRTLGFFLGLGLLSIGAAITYTAGKRPYGYAGLGDLSVLIFFGWVGVLGTYYLFTQQFEARLLLPATACGLLAVAVLNVNNIRDIESDRQAGKRSVPVRLGRPQAVIYHGLLLGGALLGAAVYAAGSGRLWSWLFLLTLPLLLVNFRNVARRTQAAELDPYLRQMAITALLFSLLLGLGQIL